MKRKTVLVTGGAVGYLLATRPGRARYQQLKTRATALRENPKVQQASERAKGLAKDKQIQQKLTEGARKAAETMKPAAHRGKSPQATPAPPPDSFDASSGGGLGG